MRIGIDGVPLLEPKTGIGRYTFELASGLMGFADAPDMVFYYGLRWGPELAGEHVASNGEQRSGLRRIVSAGLPVRAKQLLRDAVARRGPRGGGPDLFHATNYVGIPLKCPHVVTVHDLTHLKYPEMHPAARLAWMEARFGATVRKSRLVIAVSESTKRDLVQILGLSEERIRVIPLGVSPAFRPRGGAGGALGRLGLEAGRYVLTVGTLEPRKNLISALHAWSLLPDAVAGRWPLVVAGMKGWGDKAPGERFQALLHSGKVRFLGYVPDRDLPGLYAGAALFLYPSLYEGFGLPPLEAMASGVPVIVANRASLPEVVGDAGLCVEPLDAERMAAVAQGLLEDPSERAERSARGLARAAAFSWERCARETLGVYREALGLA